MKGNSQLLNPSDTLNPRRLTCLLGSEIIVGTASFLTLNEVWYKKYPQSQFHLFNDGTEWLQMDKVGHAMSSYYLGLAGLEAIKWTGVRSNSGKLLGSTLGFVYLAALEILDGKSQAWGFSLSDFAANSFGTALAIGQELSWSEQRFMLKYSFHNTPYNKIRPNVLGSGTLEASLKDYNGQTYFLSTNLSSFWPNSSIPKWLCVSFGYGAEEMISGREDADYCLQNPLVCADLHRYRQFYLSFDADLTKIPTQNKLLKVFFRTFGFIKIPSPTLEWSNRGIKGYLLYF